MRSCQLFLRGALAAMLVAAWACGAPETIELESEEAAAQQHEPIINGVPAGSQAKSIQGTMLYPSGSGYSLFCGSVYLGTNSSGQAWAATAAHCVDVLDSTDRFGFGGKDVSDFTSGNSIGWTSFQRHPQWNPNSLVNDIAVVRLDGVPPNSTPVTLATSSTDASAGETVTISGHGYSSQPSLWCLWLGFGCPPISDRLLQADTEVISTNACRATFSGVNNTHICVEDQPGQQGACNGDSGGPMFRSNGTVVGLTSYGVGGCDPDNPQVYTRISAFRSWISSETGI